MLIILVGLVIITGGIWITDDTHFLGVPAVTQRGPWIRFGSRKKERQNEQDHMD